MNEDFIDKFEKMGARVKVVVFTRGRVPVRVNILRDGLGEYFDVMCSRDTQFQVPDVREHDAHLLLTAENPRTGTSKFLCGHDEQSWFVAAVPEFRRVENVQDAKDALKPRAVWDAIKEFDVPMDQRDRRKTHAFIRQGEWFFVPRPSMTVGADRILKDEPIRRGNGKPHICQYLHRQGGVTVHVSQKFPNGLSSHEFNALSDRMRARFEWTTMERNARVFVKGKIRHPDHSTIRLIGWHEVVMNTETRARAMKHVAFLD